MIFFKSLKIYRFFKLPTFMLIQNTDILASGKKMLAKAERHIIKKYNANVLTVVPARQRDAKVSTEHLYLIYEKLGFSFKTAHTLEKFLNH